MILWLDALLDNTFKALVRNSKSNQLYKTQLEASRTLFLNAPIALLPEEVMNLYYVTGDRRQFEMLYFEHRHRLMTFGLSYWLYERQEDLEGLEAILQAICDEYSWALPAHRDKDTPFALDLFACETAYALAEILYMFEEKLDRRLVVRCLEEIEMRVLSSFMKSTDKFPFETMSNNWCAVCAGSIGMTALYLKDRSEYRAIHEKLKPTLQSFLDSFEEDGACLEGLGYWTYGMAFYVAYMALLSEKEPKLAKEMRTEKFEAMVLFQQKCVLSSGLNVNFSDAEKNEVHQPWLAMYLDHTTEGFIVPNNQPADYHGDHCYRWCHGIRNLIWPVMFEGCEVAENGLKTSDASKLTKTTKSTKTYVLPAAQWLINDGEPLGLVAKGGNNDEPHNHNDVGQFMVYKEGVDVIVDIGRGLYTRDYFHEGRYNILCNRSLGHNVPLVDGREQSAGVDYKARVVTINEDTLVIDIASAYEVDGLDALVRNLKHRGEKIVLKDTYTLSRLMAVTERFITSYKPIIEGDLVRIAYDNGAMLIKVSYESDLFIGTSTIENDVLKAISVEPLEHEGHFEGIKTYYAVDISFKLPKGQTELIFEFE